MMRMIPCLAAAASLLLSADTMRAEPRLKALIVDGQNNHDWKATTPLLKKHLSDSGLFAVDVATSPAGQDLSGFQPDFAAYDVVVSNYNGAAWPKATQAAFTQFIEDGGGLVVVHAADNAFPEWKEYNQMIGLGTTLGHSPQAMKCVGFIVTLRRGAEWAATGKVTQQEVPDDFPTPDRVSVRE